MAQTPYSANQVLASLAAPDLNFLLPHLRFVDLPQETVLFEAGGTVNRVYFPHSGIVSLVVELTTGDMIEAAMIGREGVVGGLAALDHNISISRAIVQVAGAASAVEVDAVRRLGEQSAAFRTILIKHEQVLLAQSQQSAACNATHTLEARLSRWLLRCRDLLASDEIALTQEFVARDAGRAANQRVGGGQYAPAGRSHKVQARQHPPARSRGPAGKRLRMLRDRQGAVRSADRTIPQHVIAFDQDFWSYVGDRAPAAPPVVRRPEGARITGTVSVRMIFRRPEDRRGG